MIPVTKSYEPSREEYYKLIDTIFDNGWYTNRGNYVNLLEQNIKAKLNINEANITCTSNGTLPIQIALELLGENGEVITTPFSYVATTASIVWQGLKPVFVDIDPQYLTIDETKIEAAITDKTTCILATHVFGNPCNIEAIEAIAKKHNLKVIYDAAHCFGVNYKDKSVFEYGDVSTCSFHATKVFHSGEGGAMFTKDEELFQQLFNSHNFGHNGPYDYHGLGINAKMSEFHAALGLVVLNDFSKIKSKRKKVVDSYLSKIDPNKVSFLKLRDETNWNYSYFPVIFKSEQDLILVNKLLNEKEIFPRRYFKPSLNTLNYVDNVKMPISEDVSNKILCLPLFPELEEEIIQTISNIINNNM